MASQSKKEEVRLEQEKTMVRWQVGKEDYTEYGGE